MTSADDRHDRPRREPRRTRASTSARVSRTARRWRARSPGTTRTRESRRRVGERGKGDDQVERADTSDATASNAVADRRLQQRVHRRVILADNVAHVSSGRSRRAGRLAPLALAAARPTRFRRSRRRSSRESGTPSTCRRRCRRSSITTRSSAACRRSSQRRPAPLHLRARRRLARRALDQHDHGRHRAVPRAAVVADARRRADGDGGALRRVRVPPAAPRRLRPCSGSSRR